MVTYVGASGGTSVATTGSLTLSYPAAAVNGDRCFIQFSSAATFTTPSGWTELRRVVNATVPRTTVIAYRDFDGTAASTIAITAKSAWSMLAFRKSSLSTWAIRSEGDVADTASGTTITPDPATAAQNGDASVIFVATRAVATGATGVSTTVASGWTEVSDNTTASGTTAGLQQISTDASYKLGLSSGTVTPGAYTLSQSAAASATHVIFGENPTTAYRTAVQADAPTTWWHMDESTGAAFFDSAGPHNLIVTGSPTLAGAGLESTSGTGFAPTFGTSVLQYGQVANDNTAFLPTAITVEALFQASSFNGDNRIVQYGLDGEGWVLEYRAASNGLVWWVNGHAFVEYPFSDTTSRHHVAATYDSTTALGILYVDGNEVARDPGSVTGWTTTTSTLRVAGKPTGSVATDGWNGQIDEVAIYQTVLSAGRIAAHAQAAGFPAIASTTISETFGLATSATRAVPTAAASVPNTFGLTVTATRASSAASTVPNVFALSSAASKGVSAANTVASTFGLNVSATRGPAADSTAASIFGLSSSATRGVVGSTTIAETFGLSSSANKATTGATTLPETFGLSSDATRGTAGATTLPETFGLSSTATRGTTGDASVPETFGLASTATRGTTGASTLSETFGLSSSANKATTGASTLAETFGLAITATTPGTADPDNLANAVLLTSASGSVLANNATATMETGEPVNDNQTRSLWFYFVLTGTVNSFQFDTIGSGADTVLDLFRLDGTPVSFANLTLLATDDQSAGGNESKITQFAGDTVAAPGSLAAGTYYVRYSNWAGGPSAVLNGKVNWSGLTTISTGGGGTQQGAVTAVAAVATAAVTPGSVTGRSLVTTSAAAATADAAPGVVTGRATSAAAPAIATASAAPSSAAGRASLAAAPGIATADATPGSAVGRTSTTIVPGIATADAAPASIAGRIVLLVVPGSATADATPGLPIVRASTTAVPGLATADATPGSVTGRTAAAAVSGSATADAAAPAVQGSTHVNVDLGIPWVRAATIPRPVDTWRGTPPVVSPQATVAAVPGVSTADAAGPVVTSRVTISAVSAAAVASVQAPTVVGLQRIPAIVSAAPGAAQSSAAVPTVGGKAQVGSVPAVAVAAAVAAVIRVAAAVRPNACIADATIAAAVAAGRAMLHAQVAQALADTGVPRAGVPRDITLLVSLLSQRYAADALPDRWASDLQPERWISS